MTREGAVKGLLEVADWHYGKYEQTHEEDYLNDGDFLTAVANLLKAQEPRVMTLGEYEAWIDIPFTERNPVFCEERMRRGSICYWANTTVYSRSEYGNNKRCWTSRPTEEQREAIPWN